MMPMPTIKVDHCTICNRITILLNQCPRCLKWGCERPQCAKLMTARVCHAPLIPDRFTKADQVPLTTLAKEGCNAIL